MNSKLEILTALFNDYVPCDMCSLHSIGTQKVFGFGGVDAKIVFVGIGPGKDEDAVGIPFVGPSGKLLKEYLCAVGLASKYIDSGGEEDFKVSPEVYFTNLVLCRPANRNGKKMENRDPTKEEVLSCYERLAMEIMTIDPYILVTLGDVVFKVLSSRSEKLSAFRGEVSEFTLGIPPRVVSYPGIPTWHPARLLRQTSLKSGDPRHNTLLDLTKTTTLLGKYVRCVDSLITNSRVMGGGNG